MTRTVLDSMIESLHGAYRVDRFHALLQNLEDLTDDEWHTRPANHSVEVFGTDPELSIGDIVLHAAAAKWMWANHAFGDGSTTWAEIGPQERSRDGALAWLDEGQRLFVAGADALGDDAELGVERKTHWGAPLQTGQIISIVVNHDLYHSGEINRQRSLMRGADGWERA